MQKKTKPVFILPISDTHVGSTVGLHPNYTRNGKKWIPLDLAGGYWYKNNHHYHLNSKQVKIWKHYEACIREAAKLRESHNADLLVLFLGDAIDGDHHGTHQIVTRSEPEQMKAFVTLMDWTLETLGFKAGKDRLIFIEGTESHTRDNEEIIASSLPAEKFPEGACIPFLEMDIHGRRLWAFHHGVSAGFSFNNGLGLQSFMRRVWYDCIGEKKVPPAVVLTGHTHKYAHQVFYSPSNTEHHGVILPALQEKTRYTNSITYAATQPAKVGIAPLLIHPDSRIEFLSPMLQEMSRQEALTW